jgi:hypothetical protein
MANGLAAWSPLMRVPWKQSGRQAVAYTERNVGSRFSDLRSANIVDSWSQLSRLIKNSGFPRGKMLSSNTRAWDEAEVEAWIESRPVENAAPLKGRAARRAKAAKTEAPRRGE